MSHSLAARAHRMLQKGRYSATTAHPVGPSDDWMCSCGGLAGRRTNATAAEGRRRRTQRFRGGRRRQLESVRRRARPPRARRLRGVEAEHGGQETDRVQALPPEVCSRSDHSDGGASRRNGQTSHGCRGASGELCPFTCVWSGIGQPAPRSRFRQQRATARAQPRVESTAVRMVSGRLGPAWRRRPAPRSVRPGLRHGRPA
jgi:hypothetical protein